MCIDVSKIDKTFSPKSPSSGTPGGAPSGLGGIYTLYDDNRDGVADDATNVFVLTSASVHGIRIDARRNLLYWTESEQVLSIPFISGQRRYNSTSMPIKVADLSTGGFSDRFTHTIDIDPNNATNIYVTTGQYDTYQCVAGANPRVGAVLRIGGSRPLTGDVVATGMRNPMYMRCKSFGCFAMELTGDSWLAYGGVEKLFRVVDNTNLGYPCCVLRNVSFLDPTYNCNGVTPHLANFSINSTPFGFDWERRLPAWGAFSGHLFVAMHGSFSAWTEAGVAWMAWNYASALALAARRCAPLIVAAAANAPSNGSYQQFIPGGFGHSGAGACRAQRVVRSSRRSGQGSRRRSHLSLVRRRFGLIAVDLLLTHVAVQRRTHVLLRRRHGRRVRPATM